MAENKSLAKLVQQFDRSAIALRRAGLGARVVTTPKALKNGVVRKPMGGVITGWGRHWWTVWVRKDGNKRPTPYHATFWKPEPPTRAQEGA